MIHTYMLLLGGVDGRGAEVGSIYPTHISQVNFGISFGSSISEEITRLNARQILILQYIQKVCYIVPNYTKWDKTSWTYRMQLFST